jgi:myo-inositol-1(or 4)-monophosphatase
MNSLSPPDIDSLSTLLREVARAELLPRFGRLGSREKADGSLLTEADLAVQQHLINVLSERWPTIPLLGEEMTAPEQQRLLSEAEAGLWCLDPLDGTSNFACGFPGFCISLALLRAGRVELGLVLDPIRDECFAATRGAGAVLNGQPIAPYAPADSLRDCLAIVDFKRLPASGIAELLDGNAFRSQRNLGAVALEWCWLGAGRFQLYLHGGQGLWDHAAGRLIASEAGAATELLARPNLAADPTLSLGKRIALGAANASLLAQWRERTQKLLEQG